MGHFWLQNRFMSLSLYFKLITLNSYPHPASNHSIVQKKMFKASFSSCTVKKVSATDNGPHHSSLGHSFAFVYYLLFRHLVKVLRTGALFDSGRTKVAKEEQRIWLFNQSNRGIDLNQLISSKHSNSSSSFCDERIYIQRSLELESKDRSNRTAKGMKLRKSNYGSKS